MNYVVSQGTQYNTKAGDDSYLLKRVRTTVGCALVFVVSSIATSAPEVRLGYANSTRHPVIANVSSESKNVVDNSPVSIDSMASEIKDMLGINISDLAKVIGVSRPTAYKYLDKEGPTDAITTQRIIKIHQLAQVWQAKSSKPIARELKRTYPNSPSLFEILSAEPIDMELAYNRINHLADVSNNRTTRIARASIGSTDLDSDYSIERVVPTVS